jgi:hypothetical protein
MVPLAQHRDRTHRPMNGVLNCSRSVSNLTCVWATGPSRTRADLLRLGASVFEPDPDATLPHSARPQTKTPTLGTQLHQRELG